MKRSGKNSKKSSIYFPRIHRGVTLSKHCINRMKQRARLNTKEKRKRFLRAASEECLMLSYMRGVAARVRRKNNFSYVYLYSDYFLIIASDGKAITIINVDPEYRGGYGRIKGYLKEQQKERDEVLDSTEGDDIMSP